VLVDQHATCNLILERRLQLLFGGKEFMVTLEEARRVIEAAELKAGEIRHPMNIAVVDEGWFRVHFPCLRYFDNGSRATLASGGQFFGTHLSSQGRVMMFAGGIPLARGGKVVGDVGVGGGSGEQDQAAAEAGAKAF
jgi:uncharacterized protein GlcG (DUF336 family)